MTDILALIDAELAQLRRARALLAAGGEGIPSLVRRGPGRPKGSTTAAKPGKKKRNLSPEGRARIVAAVKARWAKQKKAAAK
jgi:hypothetical protein